MNTWGSWVFTSPKEANGPLSQWSSENGGIWKTLNGVYPNMTVTVTIQQGVPGTQSPGPLSLTVFSLPGAWHPQGPIRPTPPPRATTGRLAPLPHLPAHRAVVWGGVASPDM